MSDLSQVFEMDDTCILLMDISIIIRVKRPLLHPDFFQLGIQIIDPFHGLYIAYLPEISLSGRQILVT